MSLGSQWDSTGCCVRPTCPVPPSSLQARQPARAACEWVKGSFVQVTGKGRPNARESNGTLPTRIGFTGQQNDAWCRITRPVVEERNAWYNEGMKAPMYVRALSPAEQKQIEAGLRSSDAVTLRRCQILLASNRGQRPKEIAKNLGCATQTVRNTLHAFEQQGLACLIHQSSRPKTLHTEFDQAACEALRAILHQSPRTFGKPTSFWTLELAAVVCFERGVTARQVSIETIRRALKQLGVGWPRAKHWITSPDPEYRRKKRRDARIERERQNG